MLSKLLKYDLKYMIKNMTIFYVLAIFFAITTRIFFNMEQSIIINIIGQISVGSTGSRVSDEVGPGPWAPLGHKCLHQAWCRDSPCRLFASGLPAPPAPVTAEPSRQDRRKVSGLAPPGAQGATPAVSAHPPLSGEPRVPRVEAGAVVT